MQVVIFKKRFPYGNKSSDGNTCINKIFSKLEILMQRYSYTLKSVKK